MTAIVTAITHRRKTFIVGRERIPSRKRRWSKKHGDRLLCDIEIARLQNLREQRRRRVAEPKPEPVSLNEVELDVQDANRKISEWDGEDERPKTFLQLLEEAAEHGKAAKIQGPRKAVYIPDDMFEKQLRSSCDTKEQNAWNQMQPADLPKGVRLWAEPPTNEALANLERRFPHFHAVLDLVRQRSALARLAQAGLSLPPLLLLGPPGVGKTHFARALAQAIQVHCEFVDMSCTTASWILSGASRGWEGAKPGRVHDVLLKHRHFNPVFVLDELDKASDDRRFSPLAPLYQLLERSSAKAFRDEHIPVPLDASGILWIGTANTSNLSEPLLSRMEVFTIDVPDEEQRKAIIQSVYQELQQGEDWGKHFPDGLDGNVVDFLAQSTAPAREVRRSMEAGFARAVMRNNGEPLMLAVEDVREGLHLPPVKRRIGFTS